MRVALFCLDYPPSNREGGIQHYSQQLANALSRQGIELVVVDDDRYSHPRSDGPISFVQCGGPWDKQWAHRVAHELKNNSVDIINLQYSPAMLEKPHDLAWSELTSQFPSVITLHTLWGGSRLNHWVALRLLKCSRFVIATNSEIMHLLQRYLPFFLSRTVFIPIGSNITPTKPLLTDTELQARYGFNRHECTLVYFGMSYPGKGLDMLLGAADYLRNRHQLDFQLLCVGGGVSDIDSYRETVVQRALDLGLEGSIRWTGRIPASDVSALLAKSDIVVLPYAKGVSDRRGSLMAALAHGKAIVTTPPQIRIPHFINGRNMIWPKTATPETLGEAILGVHKNPLMRRALEEGASDLAARLSWEKIAIDTCCLFERALNAHDS